jgi:hypothetical protein
MPLLLSALRHGALRTSFIEVRRRSEDDGASSRGRWCAVIVGNRQLLLGVKRSAAIASIKLYPERWAWASGDEAEAEAAANDLETEVVLEA